MYVTSEREGRDGVSVCTPNLSCYLPIFPIRPPPPRPFFFLSRSASNVLDTRNKALTITLFFLRCFTSFATFIILCDHGSFPLCSLSYYACSQFLLLSVYKQGVASTLFASTGLCIIGSPFKILILSIHQHHSRPQTKRSRTLYISIARMMPLE